MKAILSTQEEFLRPVVQQAVQAIPEVEMEECLQAGPYERADGRQGYRSGYYRRRLITRVGTIELRVPQDRAGRFSTQVFESYARSEKALVAALAQRYVQVVSTRKVAAITEELCGHEFSASSISAITAQLDGQLRQFAERPLRGEFPYVILDARYEKVRAEGGGLGGAPLGAGSGSGTQREHALVEGVSLAAEGAWIEGVYFVANDDHPGLKQAVSEGLPAALWQRCYAHFLRNTLDYLPRQADDDCLQEMRWMYEGRDVEEARRDLKAWSGRANYEDMEPAQPPVPPTVLSAAGTVAPRDARQRLERAGLPARCPPHPKAGANSRTKRAREGGTPLCSPRPYKFRPRQATALRQIHPAFKKRPHETRFCP